jgi:hypothetical protein
MKLREDLPRVVVECGNPLKFGYSDFVADYFLWLGLLFVVCDASRLTISFCLTHCKVKSHFTTQS